MTTNYITRLDEALIRPGRIDKKEDVALPKDARLGDNIKVYKAVVERHLLYYYLPELKSYRSTIYSVIISIKHLNLLIEYVKKIYRPTDERLLPLLKHIYTTCSRTKKPRYVTYDFAEEKINSIAFAFPLKYYLDKEQIKSDLVNYSRKFVSLIGTHYIYCQGKELDKLAIYKLNGRQRYKLVSLPTIRTISLKDVIIILPTVLVLELENPDFKEYLTTCLLNNPARVIIITDTYFKVTESRYSSHTRLVMFLDDHVFLPRSFLDSIVPVFENLYVGLYETKKAVRRKHYEAHSL
ncbi:hypothetical protein G7Y89_g10233 [Cudoniella acicularis]|uniref:Uncharacterized protein n=1 Tax=Cudoniella acicularis TaxID=354080 RepID=A0A8H4RD60_9HELO|nr:hypothetical protein G7Y89_g10233 [Cudoniella acicularis]